MLVTSHTYRSAGTWTPPGAMTEAVDVQHGNQSLGANYVLQAAAGATGVKTATASTQADVGNAHILALRPAAVVVPPPGSLNAFESSTAAGAIAGQIYTKLAGTALSLDIVAIQGGVQQAAFTDTVQVDLVTGSAGGLNCPGTPVTIAGTTQAVNLTNGRGTTGAFNVANAYRDVRVRMRYPVVSPTVTNCSTDNFTIRPAAFSAPTSNMTNALTSGAPVAQAGAAFTITAVAIAGYDGIPQVDNTKITAHAGAIQVGNLGGAFAAANPASGTASGTSFTYSEVGNFRIGINGVYDNSFTSVDAPGTECTNDFSNTPDGAGRYGCRFGNSAQTAVIGRFTPDHFDVAFNAPTFTTACAAGGFTYVGQKFGYTVQPVITITAKNSAGLGNATTRNYQGSSWWKITSGSLTGKSYTALAGSLDTTGISGTDPVIRYNGDGAGAGEPAAGEGTLAFNSGTGFFFTRSNPAAPFDSEISLAINVIDGDTPAIVYASNPARFGTATAGNGMAFNNGKPMRFGRLIATSARGSQLVPLSMMMELQYWNGTAFVTNTVDSCTTISASNVEMKNFSQNLDPCETNLTVGAFAKGRATARLSRPGGTNTGSVALVPRLELTPGGSPQTCIAGALQPVVGANLPHLEGKWDVTDQGADGKLYDDNPAARGTFGVYPGSGVVIDFRENF
jgi:MSHA biogenesis protein MshQ